MSLVSEVLSVMLLLASVEENLFTFRSVDSIHLLSSFVKLFTLGRFASNGLTNFAAGGGRVVSLNEGLRLRVLSQLPSSELVEHCRLMVGERGCISGFTNLDVEVFL